MIMFVEIFNVRKNIFGKIFQTSTKILVKSGIKIIMILSMTNKYFDRQGKRQNKKSDYRHKTTFKLTDG